MQDPVVIAAAKRTPIGAFQGIFKDLKAPDLGAFCLRDMMRGVSLSPEHIGEVIMGCVLAAGVGQAPARQVALKAGLPQSVPATTLNKVCGSGMRAVIMAAEALLAGSHDIVVAGGMESMTAAPYLLEKVRAGLRMGHSKLIDHMLFDGLEDAYERGALMGNYAEETADAYGFTRIMQDSFALESVHRAQKAMAEGFFTAEIVPIATGKNAEILVDKDEPIQNAKPDKISQLKPAFKADGTVTAANASSIADGAATLLLMRRSEAEKRGLLPRAILKGWASYAHEPRLFTTAPVGAVKKLYDRTGWNARKVDLWEINEAFAVVTMAAMKDLGLDHAQVNIHGGACALGHPIGATGARMLVTLLHAMERYDVKRGIATPCIGGGEGLAIALERV